MSQSALFILALALFSISMPFSRADAADQDTVTALRQGGLVLYMRHPKTHAVQADTDPLNLENVKAQRQLTDEGRQMARDIGSAMKNTKGFQLVARVPDVAAWAAMAAAK